MLSAIKCTKFIDANLVCDIVPSVGQEAGQGELVHTGRVPSVLHLNTILGHTSESPVIIRYLGQFRHQSVQAGGRGSWIRSLSSQLQHHRHTHNSTRLLLSLKAKIMKYSQKKLD